MVEMASWGFYKNQKMYQSPESVFTLLLNPMRILDKPNASLHLPAQVLVNFTFLKASLSFKTSLNLGIARSETVFINLKRQTDICYLP